MRIEKLDFNKLKITLFAEDLQMYNINLKNLTPGSPELHTFLCEMMKLVHIQTNFNPFEGQVVVEATPSPEGLVLMLSKAEMPLPVPKRIRAVKKKSKEYICRFENFAALEAFFKTAAEVGNASLYNLGEEYFLVCRSKNILPHLKEFCYVGQSFGIGEPYLKEHGKFIAEGKNLDNIVNFLKGDITNV